MYGIIKLSHFPVLGIAKEVKKLIVSLKDKNRITLPLDVVKELKLGKDDILDLMLVDGKIVLTPLVAIEKETVEAFNQAKAGKTSGALTSSEAKAYLKGLMGD